jgi:L-aminopeptidase/D-esterase-like protein
VIGSVGVGLGCRTAGLKGGFGSASTRLDSGIVVAAAVAVNAIGSVVFGDGPHFRAAPFELAGELGGLGLPPCTEGVDRIVLKAPATALGSTIIAVVATDAALDKSQARHLARVAHDGIALAVWPAHTPLDGDTIFAIATGSGATVEVAALLEICAAATATLARAIARGVYAAAADATDAEPTWRARFGDLAARM